MVGSLGAYTDTDLNALSLSLARSTEIYDSQTRAPSCPRIRVHLRIIIISRESSDRSSPLHISVRDRSCAERRAKHSFRRNDLVETRDAQLRRKFCVHVHQSATETIGDKLSLTNMIISLFLFLSLSFASLPEGKKFIKSC